MHHLRTLLTALSLVLLTSGDAQVTYERRYSIPNDWLFANASTTPDGGLVIAGNFITNQGFNTVGSLLRLDPAGNLLWMRQYDAFGPDLPGWPSPYCGNRFNGVHAVSNDRILVTGSGIRCDQIFPFNDGQWLLTGFNGAGGVDWSSVDGSLYSEGYGKIVPGDGAHVLVSGYFGTVGGSSAYVQRLLVDTSSCVFTNDLRIRDTIYISNPYSGMVNDLEFGYDGKVRVCTQHSMPKQTLTKLDTGLVVEWSRSWSDFTPMMVGGWATGATCAASDTTLIALTTNGTLDWGLELDLPGARFRDLYLLPSGEILLLGNTTGADPCSWLMQLDNGGNLQWVNRYGDTSDSLMLAQLIRMPDGGLRLIGKDATGDLVVVATDPSGMLGACSYPVITPSFLPFAPNAAPAVVIESAAWTGVPPAQAMLAVPNYPSALPVACASSLLNLQAAGRVFVDNDQDGAFGTGDAPVPFNAVQVTPDTGYVFTDPDGSYLFLPPAAGIFTIAPALLPSWWTVTTDSASYTVDLNAVTPTADSLDFGLGAALDTTVVQGNLVSPPFGCLYPVGPWASVQNLGTSTPELHITFTFDTLLTLSSTVPPADSVVGNVIHWHVDSLAHFGSLMLSPLYDAPSFMNIGDTVHLILEVHEVDSLGNLVLLASDTVTDVITCAYDPNDKQVEPLGDGPDGFIGPTTDWLTYTVRFQNTGNDTAQTVVIEDLLSQHLQWGTLQVLGASHTLTGVSVNPYGLAAFRFDGIMLPDSGANGPASQGFVRFRLRPKSALPHRTRIENTAGIHFDLNPAVVTNTVFNTMFDCSSILWQAQIVEYAGYFGADPTLEATGPMYTYQWYLNGTPIPGASGFVPYYTPTQNGNYTVLITDEDGCTSMSPAVNYIITSGPDHGPKPASLATVVPNPFGEATEVRFLQHVPAGIPLTLVDAHGRVVRSMRSDGSSVLELPRSDLAPGLYVLRIGELGSVRMAVE